MSEPANAAARPPLGLGVLISGSGTNLQAIIDAIARGELRAEIRLVISNRADAGGLVRARRAGIETAVLDNRDFPSREDFDRAMLSALKARGAEFIVLAGFMRLLSGVMLGAFPDRIINTHNALLPSFPGIHGPRDALAYGVKLAGCTVFFVTEGVDAGPVIVQAAVPVMPGDDEVRLAERIKSAEHRVLPYAIRLYQEGRLEISGRKVVIKDPPEPESGVILVNPPIR